MLVYVLQQQVERRGGENKEDRVHQVGDDGEGHKSGVLDDVPSRCRRVAGNVQLGIEIALGKAAGDADYEVEDTCNSCKAFK